MAQPVAASANKRALIIAIGDYPQSSGWPTISSANDVPLIKSALAYQKFSDKAITVVADAGAKKESIIRAIKTLIDQSQSGDKVIIHFSSHGQQISDDSNDELDGYDEAIVCYGAPVRSQLKPDYDGSQHLRDDELNSLIEQLRAKLGATGDILLIADACHSGTISRGGIANVRGNGQPYDLPGKPAKKIPVNGQPQPFLAPDQSAKSALRGTVASGMAPYVIISAAKAGELNYEYLLPDGSLKGVGSLSYAVNKALRTVGAKDTYRTLFNRIVSEMKLVAPQQTPEIDGDYDRELFGGKAIQQALYYPIQRIQDGGRQVIIPAGRLETINADTRVRLCPENTSNPMQATSFISGTVVEASMFSATIQLDKPITASQQQAHWVFVTDRSFGDLSVAISLDSLRSGPQRTSVQGVLGTLPLVKFTNPLLSELYVAQLDSAGSTYAFIRKTTDGFMVGGPIPITTTTLIRERVEDYAQGKFLQSFSADYEGISLDISLKPVKPGGKVIDTLRQSTYMHNGLLQLAFANRNLSDSAVVVVTNTGKLTVYYSIIDIQPDGIVNVLFPMSERPQSNGKIIRDYPANYQIKPGEQRLIPTKIGFSPPFGTETFKVLASTEEFDLRNIMNMRARGASATRGLSKAIERVFGSAQVLTRGGGTALPPGSAPIGTFNYPFRIVRARTP